MTIKNFFSYALVAFAMFAFAGIAAAQTSDSASVTMNATLETAITLEISDGTGGVEGTGTPSAFIVGLGTIDGLGLGTPDDGVDMSSDANGAVWTTPINVTATFSGLSGTENAVVTVDPGSLGDEALMVEGALAASASSVTADKSVNTDATSGTPIERHVGFAILRTEAAQALSAQLIYTVTIETAP